MPIRVADDLSGSGLLETGITLPAQTAITTLADISSLFFPALNALEELVAFASWLSRSHVEAWDSFDDSDSLHAIGIAQFLLH